MNWHYNHARHEGEDGSMKHPFLPVQFRLIGTQNSVAAYLNMLETIFILADVSDPIPARHGLIRVYGVIYRRHPLQGGLR